MNGFQLFLLILEKERMELIYKSGILISAAVKLFLGWAKGRRGEGKCLLCVLQLLALGGLGG